MAIQPKIPASQSPKYDGELKGQNSGQDFAQPMVNFSHSPEGVGGLYDDIGEKSGFQIDGYLDKKGQAYGEGAKLNFLPPGMDIGNQENCDIRMMPLKKLVEESYSGDGWEPKPRDVPEFGRGTPGGNAWEVMPESKNAMNGGLKASSSGK